MSSSALEVKTHLWEDDQVQTYVERAPIPALAALASAVWIQQVPPDAEPYVQRTIPHGGTDLVFTRGATPQVIGPQTRPRVELLAPGTTVIGMRLRPGVAGPVLGLPATEIADRTVALDDLWGRTARMLADQVGALGPAALQRHIAAGRAAAPDPDPLVLTAVGLLMPWRVSDLGALPALLSISERHLRRRCHAALGLPAKTLHRMLRFQGFLAQAQQALAEGRAPTAAGLARLAVESGYADQAHLNRECARLTGMAPRMFLAAAEQSCGCGHDHAASFEPLLRNRGRFVQGARTG